MNKSDYNKLRKQVEDKYQQAIQAAEKLKKEELDAIERVWDLLKETEQKTPIAKIVDSPKTKSNIVYGSFKAAIMEAIKLVHVKKFTKKDIRLVLPQVSMEIAASCKDASLTGCLIRLEKQGIIKKIKAGKGSSPSLYKKVSDAQD